MIFKKKKPVEPMDERSEIEKKFEDRGREIGAKTGEIVQKASDKYQKVKTKIADNEKVQKLNQKTKSTIEKGKSKVRKNEKDEK